MDGSRWLNFQTSFFASSSIRTHRMMRAKRRHSLTHETTRFCPSRPRHHARRTACADSETALAQGRAGFLLSARTGNPDLLQWSGQRCHRRVAGAFLATRHRPSIDAGALGFGRSWKYPPATRRGPGHRRTRGLSTRHAEARGRPDRPQPGRSHQWLANPAAVARPGNLSLHQACRPRMADRPAHHHR